VKFESFSHSIIKNVVNKKTKEITKLEQKIVNIHKVIESLIIKKKTVSIEESKTIENKITILNSTVSEISSHISSIKKIIEIIKHSSFIKEEKKVITKEMSSFIST